MPTLIHSPLANKRDRALHSQVCDRMGSSGNVIVTSQSTAAQSAHAGLAEFH